MEAGGCQGLVEQRLVLEPIAVHAQVGVLGFRWDCDIRLPGVHVEGLRANDY